MNVLEHVIAVDHGQQVAHKAGAEAGDEQTHEVQSVDDGHGQQGVVPKVEHQEELNEKIIKINQKIF